MMNMRISTAEQMNPTKRNTMEDCHVSLQPNTWGHDSVYLGVYDGHGGRDIVDFLQDALHENIAEELTVGNDHDNNENKDGGDKDGITSSFSHAGIQEKLERAFLITDVQSRMEEIETSGATVAVCIVERHIVDSKMRVRIHAANAGDARAVLSFRPDLNSSTSTSTSTIEANMSVANSSSFRLTSDHKADDPKEIARIENAGGFLLRNRVLGIMAVARSLGDHGMKEFVIARPFCQSIEFELECSHDEEKEFIILACDGLWDTIEDEEAIGLVKTFVMQASLDADEKKSRRDLSAEMLCKEAIKRGSTDNVTVTVAWL